MRKLMDKPKYDGYKIKCKTCKCRFFAPFKDVRAIGYDDLGIVYCPNCDAKIYQSIFWRKHREGEDK